MSTNSCLSASVCGAVARFESLPGNTHCFVVPVHYITHLPCKSI